MQKGCFSRLILGYFGPKKRSLSPLIGCCTRLFYPQMPLDVLYTEQGPEKIRFLVSKQGPTSGGTAASLCHGKDEDKNLTWLELVPSNRVNGAIHILGRRPNP